MKTKYCDILWSLNLSLNLYEPYTSTKYHLDICCVRVTAKKNVSVSSVKRIDSPEKKKVGLSPFVCKCHLFQYNFMQSSDFQILYSLSVQILFWGLHIATEHTVNTTDAAHNLGTINKNSKILFYS